MFHTPFHLNKYVSASLEHYKIGLKYIPDTEELQITIYEANELHRPPSSDLPNTQIQLLFGQQKSKVTFKFKKYSLI